MGLRIDQLHERLLESARRAGFQTDFYGKVGEWSLPVFTREPEAPVARVYLSTGVHGDEPAGPLAVLQMLRDRAFAPEISWTLYPLINPLGLAAGTRENADGHDLNRDYGPTARCVEVQAHMAHIGDARWDLALCLHEDYEGQGSYLYELLPESAPWRAAPILQAMAAHTGVDPRDEIDEMPAANGRMMPSRDDHEDWTEELPEAVWLWRHHAPWCYTLETPSEQPITARIAAQIAGVQATVKTWQDPD